jgi:O-antigen/teichoic acid export membrane protein
VASQFLIRWVDLLVIGLFATTATVGVYAVAYQAYMALQAGLGAVTAVLTPLLVSLREHRREAELPVYVAGLVPRTTLLASLFLGFAAALCPLLAPVVFGADFERVGEPLALLLLSAAILFPAFLLAPVLILHERTPDVGVINAVAAGVNLVLDFVFIGLLGFHLLGAALATAAASAVITLWYRRVTTACLQTSIPLPVRCFGPAATGVLAALLLPVWTAALLGTAASLVVAVLIGLVAPRFPALPPDWAERVGLPRPLRRSASRVVHLGG